MQSDPEKEIDAMISEFLSGHPTRRGMKFCPRCGEALLSTQIEGKERQKCSSVACQYVFWNNPTPVVAAIVEYENKVVLARHRGWPLGLFGLISGFLEEGETPEAGILREVNEELSLEGSIVKTIGHYSFPEMNQLIIAFYILARGKLSMNEELVEIKHVRPDKLIPWSLGAGPAVKDWLEARID